MVPDNQGNASELATSKDYRNYFGVPPKSSSPRDFVRWAQLIYAAVVRELDRTSLTSGQREILRNGLAMALKVLAGHYAGAVQP